MQPLYIIDGKEMPDATAINDVNAADIESLEAVVAQNTLAIYNDRGKNGAVKISL